MSCDRPLAEKLREKTVWRYSNPEIESSFTAIVLQSYEKEPYKAVTTLADGRVVHYHGPKCYLTDHTKLTEIASVPERIRIIPLQFLDEAEEILGDRAEEIRERVRKDIKSYNESNLNSESKTGSSGSDED